MKQATIFLIISILFVAGCQKRNENLFVVIDNPETSFVIEDSILFPEILDTFLNSWYSSHLLALKESSLFKDTTALETYRFSWLRTFHHPITIRFEKQKNSYILYWKECDGAGGYDPGKLIVNKQMEVDEKTWLEFKDKINEIDFWNLPTEDYDRHGKDGAQWILEGKNPEPYHFTDRWTPKENSAYYQCCDFLIRLTDLNIDEEEKY